VRDDDQMPVAHQKRGEVEYNSIVKTMDENQWRLETSWGGEAEEGGEAVGQSHGVEAMK